MGQKQIPLINSEGKGRRTLFSIAQAMCPEVRVTWGKAEAYLESGEAHFWEEVDAAGGRGVLEVRLEEGQASEFKTHKAGYWKEQIQRLDEASASGWLL